MTRPPRKSQSPAAPDRRQRGFEPASVLLQKRVQVAGESRGFSVTRLLTHWAEIAGADLAEMTQPVKVGYSRDGMGATLTLLCAPGVAPLVQMRQNDLRDRVNAAYGYNAISRIAFTQTAPTGFAEGQTPFSAQPASAPARPDPAVVRRATETADGVQDPGLRAALEALAQNVLSRART